MKRMFQFLPWCGLAVLSGIPAAAADISGFIQLLGCQAAPSQFRIAASPISGYVPKQRGRKISGSNGLVHGVVSQSRTGGLQFTVANLNKADIYRLSIQIGDGTCGQMFWQSPVAGAVAPGMTNIVIKGYAARTRVEIFNEGARGAVRQWVGATQVDFLDSTAATRRLRVATDLPNANSVVLQVASRRFVTSERGAEAARL